MVSNTDSEAVGDRLSGRAFRVNTGTYPPLGTPTTTGSSPPATR